MEKKSSSQEFSEDNVLSDYHIYEIASYIEDWEILSTDLDLTQAEVEEIKNNSLNDFFGQKKNALSLWKSKKEENATYRALKNICCANKMLDLAEKIERCQQKPIRPRHIPVLDEFYRSLVYRYQSCPHPSKEQLPSRYFRMDDLPTNSKCCFLDLSLNQGPLIVKDKGSQTGTTESISDNFSTVTLQKVFSSTGKLMVYFEGIGGSGKTTLSWHSCREWSNKRLLAQFDLLIQIELKNELNITRKVRLQDIIPSDNCREIAEAILSTEGERICFLLDGLDEAPSSVVDFYFVNLFQVN